MATILYRYPEDGPLQLGAPDGIVRPARMICTAYGMRTGATLWVTGTAVDAHLGTHLELIEGEVTFPFDPDYGYEEPSERFAGIDAASGEPVPVWAPDPYQEGIGREIHAAATASPADYETGVADDLVGKPDRQELEDANVAEVRALVDELGLDVDKRNKGKMIDAIMAHYQEV
jgi:hypothetical protein